MYARLIDHELSCLRVERADDHVPLANLMRAGEFEASRSHSARHKIQHIAKHIAVWSVRRFQAAPRVD
jgi:hypothetical protein